MTDCGGAVHPRWWREEGDAEGAYAVCGLCGHNCRIPDGKSGLCRSRFYSSSDGFSSPYLGRFAAVAVDPIEKKPLLHWRQGSYIMSLGSVGCNMTCPFCQNHQLSNPIGGEMDKKSGMPEFLSPEKLLNLTKKSGLSSVAYTYNEPTLQAEYIFEASHMLSDAGIATVMVTNGMFSSSVCDEAARRVDALNIDVKAFDSDVYRKLGGSLKTVMSNVECLVTRGRHVELTNLVVPGVSDSADDFAAMIDWIAGLSREIPLHISRYFPAFRSTAPPTDLGVMKKFERLAAGRLAHVHLGNV
jgi:pyruvate formate lyase activating enzyme